MHTESSIRNERGIALVVALLVLLVLSLLAAALMMSVNVETLLAGHSQRGTQALNTAEAGLAEAVARIKSGEIPNNLNPAMTAKIFNAAPGSVPVLSGGQVALATAQPAGQWLRYSTNVDGPDVLTVRYRVENGQVMKYDPDENPAVQPLSGSPIFVVTSTGYDGRDRRRIQEEVISKPFDINVKAALAADVKVDLSGNGHVCGYDHDASTPTGTDDLTPCTGYEGGPDPPLPGAYSTGPIDEDGSSSPRGLPADYLEAQIGFYAGPWESLKMTQAEFFQWVGAPINNEPSPPRGVYYLDNNLVHSDKSGDYAYHGGNGEGMLYVDGDLTVNGNFNYRGLIYVEGDLHLNGNLWVLGGMIVKGQTDVKIANGSMSILYSSEAIQQALQKYGGSMVAISWKEL